MRLLLLLVALWTPHPTFAHGTAQREQLLLQVQSEHSEALLLYEISSGTDAALLRSTFDRDHNGTLDEDERKGLALELSRDAFVGLSVTRNGTSLSAVDLDWRLELGEGADGRILIALMLRFAEGGPGRYALSLEPRPAARSPLTIEGEAGEGLIIASAINRPTVDGIATGQLVLAPGDSLWFEVTSVEDTPSE